MTSVADNYIVVSIVCCEIFPFENKKLLNVWYFLKWFDDDVTYLS